MVRNLNRAVRFFPWPLLAVMTLVVTYPIHSPPVWAQTDNSPSIRMTAYLCGADGGWGTGAYCSSMLPFLEQVMGWADGNLVPGDPSWADSVWDEKGAGVRLYQYATLKGMWATRYADTTNVPVGRHAFLPATNLYKVCAERWPDSAADMYERLFEHYKDSAVFADGETYVLCPPADPDDDGRIEAEDSVARVICYMVASAYGTENVDYRGTTCKKATGKGRILLDTSKPWQREVIARAYATIVNTTGSTYYYGGLQRPYRDLYFDNCDMENAQVRGQSNDQLGSVALSYEAPTDSNGLTADYDLTGTWTVWKHRQTIKTLLTVRDTLEARSGGHLAANVVWNVDYSKYVKVDTGGGGIADLARIQLNTERMGGWTWLSSTANYVVRRYVLNRYADIETLIAHQTMVNWDSWVLDSEGVSGTTVALMAGAANRWQTLHYAAMCAYYMCKPQNPAKDTMFWTSFGIGSCTNCDFGGEDTWNVLRWCNAMGVDIGDPDAAPYIAYKGPCDDGPGQRSVSLDTTQIFRRDYSDTSYIVLLHPAYQWGTHENNQLGDSIYVTYNPADIDTFQLIEADSSLGNAVVSINLPIGAGRILRVGGSQGGEPPASQGKKVAVLR